MKLLLYCTKGKPYLNDYRLNEYCNKFVTMSKPVDALNGKIVAECDFEMEEIKLEEYDDYNDSIYSKTYYETKTLQEDDLCKQSCLTSDELDNYLKQQNGYAIHIKNLKVFDDPSKLSNYLNYITKNGFPELNKPIKKAPQNMMYCYLDDDGEYYDDENEAILISIRPEWLCKILNGEKTIEVRKKVLKEMIGNGNHD